MFPSPEIASGSNRVEGFHTYIFPPEHRYVFDRQAGEEKIFIVFSRDPKPDFEQLVYSLQGGKTKPVSRAGAGRAAKADCCAPPSTIPPWGDCTRCIRATW